MDKQNITDFLKIPQSEKVDDLHIFTLVIVMHCKPSAVAVCLGQLIFLSLGSGGVCCKGNKLWFKK